tara:strand:- start:28048 stop:28239 length:192 start_codon:yes stop_codon:yes gene_type:complete
MGKIDGKVLATVPIGWEVAVLDSYVLAIHPENEPRVISFGELPRPFEEWDTLEFLRDGAILDG